MLLRKYRKLLTTMPPCAVSCDCQEKLSATDFIGIGFCPHGNRVSGVPPIMSVEEFNALAAETLAQCHGSAMPADPEALRLNELRRAPYIKSAEQLRREREAAQAYYAEVPRSMKYAFEARFGGTWGI